MRNRNRSNRKISADGATIAYVYIIISSILLIGLLGGFIAYVVVSQNQIASIDNTASYARAAVDSNNVDNKIFSPVIDSLKFPNGIFINGTFTYRTENTYQYVYVLRNGIIYESQETPKNNLPLFSTTLKEITFPDITGFENDDKIVNAFYDNNILSEKVVALDERCVRKYEMCFVNTTGNNICYNNNDYCNYPITLNFGLPTQTTINNLNEFKTYISDNIYESFQINPSNGCIITLIPCEINDSVLNTRLTTNITIINIAPDSDPFIIEVNTQLNSRVLRLCTTGYSIPDYTDYLEDVTPEDRMYDFYVNYGDGTPIQYYSGMYGNSNQITHTYAVDAPSVTNVTMVGSIPSYSCSTMARWVTYSNEMLRDIISWGNVGMTQAGFGLDQNFARISAGPPPAEMTGFYRFFSSSNSGGDAWANLDKWNTTNMDDAIYMFLGINAGTLNLTGWVLPELKAGYGMFYQLQIPIIGELNDMIAPKIVNTAYMFDQYDGNALTLPNFYPSKMILAESMFRWTSQFANVNITNWNVEAIQNTKNMFFGCNEIVIDFNTWGLQNVTSCDYTIQKSNYLVVREISTSSNYNEILINWNTKTPISLVCNWGTGGGFRLAIPLTASGDGLAARTALCGRGWAFQDGNGAC